MTADSERGPSACLLADPTLGAPPNAGNLLMTFASLRRRNRSLLLAATVVCGIVVSVWGSILAEHQLSAVARVWGDIFRLLAVIALAWEAARLLRRRSTEKASSRSTGQAPNGDGNGW
jgi:threonine/homoserine/homoserine lactone efflux protein